MSSPDRQIQTDTPVMPIVWAGIILGLVVIATGLVTYGFFRFLESHEPAAPTVSTVKTGPDFPPQPRLQVDPETELRELRDQERERLGTYGWVDREKGIVHVPVSRAMELQLERGFPTRKETSR